MEAQLRAQSLFSLPTQRCFFPYGVPWHHQKAFLCLRRGVSLASPIRQTVAIFSLPTQRCFLVGSAVGVRDVLFSAYAEVFPQNPGGKRFFSPFLCLRRGVSSVRIHQPLKQLFSLPTQRCFSVPMSAKGFGLLFSAYAEVFPQQQVGDAVGVTFLCLRRGVSRSSAVRCLTSLFSLPTQRCFLLLDRAKTASELFSAYAEVFPSVVREEVEHHDFSLPTQRCFLDTKLSAKISQLFSAYAEVFPVVTVAFVMVVTFLCLRRGVSVMPPGLFLFFTFSLPTQRCFQLAGRVGSLGVLFSAYAEVFPFYSQSKRAPPPFLCLRRGVSSL